MSGGFPIRSGDLVRVQGGMVFIGQTGIALQDAPHGSGKIDVQFNGYPNPKRVNATLLAVVGKSKAPLPERGLGVAAHRVRESDIITAYDLRIVSLKKARDTLVRINSTSEQDQREDEELTYIEGEKRRELEQRRRKQAFWA